MSIYFCGVCVCVCVCFVGPPVQPPKTNNKTRKQNSNKGVASTKRPNHFARTESMSAWPSPWDEQAKSKTRCFPPTNSGDFEHTMEPAKT